MPKPAKVQVNPFVTHPVTFQALKLSPRVIQFPGVDLGGGVDTVPIIAEAETPGSHSVIVIKTPAATVWLGTGEGYRYTPIRFEVYRLEAAVPGQKDARERTATFLVSFPARQPRAQRPLRRVTARATKRS